MADLLKTFSGNKQVMEVLNDPEKLKIVLFMIQDAADEYMNEAQALLEDNRKSSQEKAEAALNIAQSIIEAEKALRELELYNFVGLKSRGMSVITDV